MPSWITPTAADVTDALARLGQAQQRAYFFERLENPLWVEPLHRLHAFDSVPDPIPADEPGYVSFPPWPEGTYLARVARHVPAEVRNVLRRVNSNDNPIVARALFETAATLPDAQLRDVLPAAEIWLHTPHLDWYADAAVAFIARAFELGRTKQALALARLLLTVEPDRRLDDKRDRREELSYGPTLEPTARLDDWEYSRALEQLAPVATVSAGPAFVNLLDRLLHDALRHSQWEDDESDASDFSTMWRPAIEDHEQNHDRDVRNAIITALRDAVIAVTTSEPERFDEVVGDLLRGSIVHRRIGFYVLSQSDLGIETVVRYLGDVEFLDDYRFKHEVAQLLDARWTDLDGDTREGVLAWIDAGDVDRYTTITQTQSGEPPMDNDVELHMALWQRDRYSQIARHLTGSHKDRYDALRARFGEAEHADLTTWMGTWVGTTGPVDPDELRTWSIDRIDDFLTKWQPSNVRSWPPGPTIEGLGNTVKEVVTTRAAEFARHAADLADVDPTYVRAVLAGIETALKEGTEIEWRPLLALADSVAARPFEPDVEEPDQDRDPGYRWVRRHVSSTLQTGLQHKTNPIAWEHREQLWSVIERLTDDPNPTPEHEARFGGDNMDPLTLSLNTNRAYALHTIVEYGLWCHRQLTAQGAHAPTASEHFPEVLAVLDRHLDPLADPSLAVRAVYGRWYAWLLLLDEHWAASRAEAIFGPLDSPTEHGDVAWDTYIVWTPPYDGAFRTLHPWYERAISRLAHDVVEHTSPRRSPHQKLGEHLTTFAWRGEDDNELAQRYFDAAPDNLTGSVTAFIGDALSNTAELVPAIATRIEAHWERRMEVLRANPDAHRGELQAFSTWFVSGKLDQTWTLNMLEETLGLAGAPRHSKDTVERLSHDDIDPVVAVRLLSSIIQRENNPWEHVVWREPAKTILRRATEHAEGRDPSRRIIDYFVRGGDLSFREFAATPRED